MKKITKNAAILAAMSIMIAGATMAASAAEEGWNGNDDDGWTYVENGAKVKKAWKQINGIWYYFKGDGTMAQNELQTIGGKTYFLSDTGALGVGWQEMTDDMDLFDDIDNDVTRGVAIDGADEYDETLWMYFNPNGGAARENEWFQDTSGLWYYFEGQTMVSSDVGFEISDKFYGFDNNGAMLVGWNEATFDKNDDRPTGSADTAWFYFGTNGQRNGTDSWKKVDGSWYYFDDNAELKTESVIKVDKEVFYVNEDGVMQSGGIVELPEDTVVSGDAVSASSSILKKDNKLKDAIKVKLNSKGKMLFGKDGEHYLSNEIGTLDNVYQASKKHFNESASADMAGQLMTDVFLVEDGGDITYYDEDGSRVKNSAVTFYDGDKKLKIAFDKDGHAALASDYQDEFDDKDYKIKVGTKSYTAKNENNVVETETFIYTDSDGKTTTFEVVVVK